jgi:hypothetical protein
LAAGNYNIKQNGLEHRVAVVHEIMEAAIGCDCAEEVMWASVEKYEFIRVTLASGTRQQKEKARKKSKNRKIKKAERKNI